MTAKQQELKNYFPDYNPEKHSGIKMELTKKKSVTFKFADFEASEILKLAHDNMTAGNDLYFV